MTKNLYITAFKVETDRLTKDELAVLGKLIDAAKLIAEIYSQQMDKHGNLTFYPADATRAEIERAATKNKQIFSPYTVVERDQDGQLVAVPYHIKYQEALLGVAQKLEEAAQLSTNREFSQVLQIQAQALLNGDYDEAQVAWMKIKPYMIDIAIGPFERIEDQLFFVKRSYQAWVGLMNLALTERANTFKDTTFSARRKFTPSGERVDFMDKAQIRVDNTVIFAGMIAKYGFTATTLPNDIEILEKYGSEATIFWPEVRQALVISHWPIFNLIFAPHFKRSFSDTDLQRGYLYLVMMHEIARILVRYRFAFRRLRELYPIFNEMTIEAQAVKLCGSLLLKDVLCQKEMESILVMFLTRIFDYFLAMQDQPGSKPYVLGNAVLLNSLIASGALQISKEGISWPNFTKVFIAVTNLADEIEKVLAQGSYQDGQKYLKKHSSLAAFEKFSTALKALRKGRKKV